MVTLYKKPRQLHDFSLRIRIFLYSVLQFILQNKPVKRNRLPTEPQFMMYHAKSSTKLKECPHFLSLEKP